MAPPKLAGVGSPSPDAAMEDDALFALGKMTHSSPAMFERRRRILREARRMIASVRIDDFNIRELCRRADVSSRTVYNAFGSKEAVVALAIKDYFEAFHRSMTFVSPADSFAGALERAMAATLRNLQIPNYLHAVTALYFSPTLDRQIRHALLDTGQRPWLAWLLTLKRGRQLERGLDPLQIASDLSDAQYSKVHQWGLGEIEDGELARVTARTVLTMLAGAARGASQEAVRTVLSALVRDDESWSGFIAEIQERIDGSFAATGKGGRNG